MIEGYAPDSKEQGILTPSPDHTKILNARNQLKVSIPVEQALNTSGLVQTSENIKNEPLTKEDVAKASAFEQTLKERPDLLKRLTDKIINDHRRKFDIALAFAKNSQEKEVLQRTVDEIIGHTKDVVRFFETNIQSDPEGSDNNLARLSALVASAHDEDKHHIDINPSGVKIIAIVAEHEVLSGKAGSEKIAATLAEEGVDKETIEAIRKISAKVILVHGQDEFPFKNAKRMTRKSTDDNPTASEKVDNYGTLFGGIYYDPPTFDSLLESSALDQNSQTKIAILCGNLNKADRLVGCSGRSIAKYISEDRDESRFTQVHDVWKYFMNFTSTHVVNQIDLPPNGIDFSNNPELVDYNLEFGLACLIMQDGQVPTDIKNILDKFDQEPKIQSGKDKGKILGRSPELTMPRINEYLKNGNFSQFKDEIMSTLSWIRYVVGQRESSTLLTTEEKTKLEQVALQKREQVKIYWETILMPQQTKNPS